ncbi:MAG: PAS domain S-box protein [Balneola sp.]
MTLERKIISSFLLLGVLLVGIGLIWELYYTEINNKQFAESKNANTVVDHTNQMEVGLYQTLIYLNLIHETRSGRENIEDIRDIPLKSQSIKGFENGIKSYYSASDELQEMVANKPFLQEEVNELRKRVLLYESLSKDWLEIGDELVDESSILFLSSVAPYFLNNIMPKFDEIRNIVIQQQEQVINQLDKQLSQGRIINYSATFVILIIGVFIGLYLYRSIVQPLQRLTYSVKKFGEGNLNQRVEINSVDEFSYVSEAFNTMAENLEQQTISSTYLDNLMESISESIFVIDTNGIVNRLNGAGAKMLGLEKNELIGQSIYDFFNLTEPKEHVKDGRIQEYQLENVNDKKVPVLFSESDLIEDGIKKGRVFVVRDISELKAAETEIKNSLEEKNVMLAEIHHRVKNNLAVISGLLQLQVMQSDSEEISKALTDSQLRVQSIALIHEKLYGSDSLAYIKYDKYIQDLIHTINKTYANEHIEINVITNIEDISLNINQAIPCSLLVNEVLVNTYKHAFKGLSQGEITIDIFEKNERISVVISDNGRGFDDKKEEKKAVQSLGLTLIKTLVAQLGGKYNFSNNENEKGAVFSLTFKKEH